MDVKQMNCSSTTETLGPFIEVKRKPGGELEVVEEKENNRTSG